MDFIKEFTRFMLARKKYWLVPILIALLFIGFLIVFSQGTAMAPFVYTLF